MKVLFSGLFGLAALAGAIAVPVNDETNTASAAFSKWPVAPGLTFLYDMYAEIGQAIMIPNTPAGDRGIYPIVGGSFTGPNITGTVLNLGADWGTSDSQTSFFPDTRYNLRTSDGYDIYIRTQGAYQASGIGFLSGKYESSRSQPYSWMNEIVAYGTIEDVTYPKSNATLAKPKLDPKNTVLRIQMWHF